MHTCATRGSSLCPCAKERTDTTLGCTIQSFEVHFWAAWGCAALSTSLPHPNSLNMALLMTPVPLFMKAGTLKPLFSHLSSCLTIRPVCAHKRPNVRLGTR